MNARFQCLRLGASRLQRGVSCRASNAKFLVGGNWKCNGTQESVSKLVSGLNSGNVPGDVDVVVAPVFIHLKQVIDTLDLPVQISAQDCWTGEGGAFTGEVTADMLADLGVPWTITGHSERRALCGETSDMVGEKTAYAISKGLKVIACIGESLPQRESGELWDVLDGQMAALKSHVQAKDWSDVVIAYEPIWAIGTGVVATPDQAQEVHAWLRKWVTDNVSPGVADQLRILYGGSVKGANSAELAGLEDVDGFLVGGASLDAQEFLTICNARSGAAAAA